MTQPIQESAVVRPTVRSALNNDVASGNESLSCNFFTVINSPFEGLDSYSFFPLYMVNKTLKLIMIYLLRVHMSINKLIRIT